MDLHAEFLCYHLERMIMLDLIAQMKRCSSSDLFDFNCTTFKVSMNVGRCDFTPSCLPVQKC
jgi:hypothetical protein